MAKLNNTKTVEELNDDMTKDVLPVTVFIALEILIGFFGNILILLVYSKRYKRINFRYFVLALSIVDLTSCCTTLPGEIFSQLNWYTYEHGWICKVKSYFNVFTAWASASILLSMAVDRYRKICHPFKWQIRVHVAFRLCGFCFLISAIMAIPVAVLWGKQTYNFDYHGENVSVSVCEKSGQYANTIYPLVYIIGVYLVPVSLMIVVAMTLNFIIARKLFGQSMKSSIKKTHLTKTAKATELTTDSSGESIGAPTRFMEENRQDTSIKHADSESSVNSFTVMDTSNHEKNDMNISHDKGAELMKPDTNRSMFSKQTSKLVVCRKTAGEANEGNRVRDSLADKYSIDEEISGGYFSGSSQDDENHASHDRKRKLREWNNYRKSKTMIMLILTSIFAVTMALYIILTSFVAKPDGILKDMPDSEKAAFFFFWRLYFINSVVNPILYGFMDPRFRSGLMSYIPSKTNSSSSPT